MYYELFSPKQETLGFFDCTDEVSCRDNAHENHHFAENRIWKQITIQSWLHEVP